MQNLIFKTLSIFTFFYTSKSFVNIENPHKLYYSNNEVLTLREELSVEGVEEDSAFKGGLGVERWIVLPSYSAVFLVGVKKQGLSLVTVSKKVANVFQAIEKQIDVGENVVSAVAFNHLNPEDQRSEGVVIVATDSPKHEIIWFKIINYKLVKYWTWVRYSGTSSLHHFTVMREDRLLILDANSNTAYLYDISLHQASPSIRELEVISFREKVLSLSVSLQAPEPFLYVLHKTSISLYRYVRFCPESWLGSFVHQTSLPELGVRQIQAFHSAGQEYLLLSGTPASVLKIDNIGNIFQEMKTDNIIEWLVMRSGPEKERVVLFGKSDYGEVNVFSNAGAIWNKHTPPSCFKYNKLTQNKEEIGGELSCLRDKSWSGTAVLEIGDLPTLIFADRKYYGEMYHVFLSVKRDIVPLSIPYGGFPSDLIRMKSSLEDFVSDINTGRSADHTCSVFDTVSTIERLVEDVKRKLSNQCSHNINEAETLLFSKNKTSHPTVSEEQSYLKKDDKETGPFLAQTTSSYISDEGSLKEDERKLELLSDVQLQNKPLNAHPISPDLQEDISLGSLNDVSKSYHLSGLPKTQDHVI